MRSNLRFKESELSLPKRTQKDEDSYNAILRREEPIKTEVIIELKQANQRLLENQERLIRSLLEMSDQLRVYRVQALANVELANRSPSHCLSGCTRHEWNDVDGWRQKGASQ